MIDYIDIFSDNSNNIKISNKLGDDYLDYCYTLFPGLKSDKKYCYLNKITRIDNLNKDMNILCKYAFMGIELNMKKFMKDNDSYTIIEGMFSELKPSYIIKLQIDGIDFIHGYCSLNNINFISKIDDCLLDYSLYEIVAKTISTVNNSNDIDYLMFHTSLSICVDDAYYKVKGLSSKSTYLKFLESILIHILNKLYKSIFDDDKKRRIPIELNELMKYTIPKLNLRESNKIFVDLLDTKYEFKYSEIEYIKNIENIFRTILFYTEWKYSK